MWLRDIFRPPNSPADPALTDGPVDFAGQLTPRLYQQLDRLRLRSEQPLQGSGAGLRRSVRRRPAADFLEHRQYVPGDDVRFVDWRATARHEQIFLKQGEHPQENQVTLLIDASASMAWGAPPKASTTLALAACLSYLALGNEDRLTLVVPGRPGGLVKVKGKGQYPAVLNHLRTLRFSGTPALAAELHLIARHSQTGGMLIVLSDLLDQPDLAVAFAELPPPHWQVSVLHLLHPEELEPPVQGEFALLDAESGLRRNVNIDRIALQKYARLLEDWRRAIELSYIERHAQYTLVPTGWSLEREAVPHLRRVRLLEPR